MILNTDTTEPVRRMLHAPYLLALPFFPSPNLDWREAACRSRSQGTTTLRNLYSSQKFLLLGSENHRLTQSYITVWGKLSWSPCALSTGCAVRPWQRQRTPWG